MPITIDVKDADGDAVTVMTNDKIAELIGEVQASPTANTLLARVKALETLMAAAVPAGTNVIGRVGVDQTTPGTTDSVTVATAQGAGATIGAAADAAVAAGAAGTLSAKMRRISQGLEDLKTLIVLAAGAAVIGKVGIDQTTPGTTDSVTLATGQGAGATIGAANDAAATAGGTGTLSAKLRRVTQGLEDLKTLVVLAAGTNLIGRVSGSAETSTVYDGTTALTPKFAPVAVSSSGNNTVVAAVASKKIRVLAYNFIGNGAVNAKFQTGAGGTDLTGLKYIAAAGGGICAPFNPAGWFETAAGALLNLNLSGAVAVGGEIVYVEV